MQNIKGHEFKNHNLFFVLLLVSLTLIGVLLGTIGFCTLPVENIIDLSFVKNNLIDSRESMSYMQIIFNSFVSGSVFLLVPFFLGFCSISQPLLFLIPVFKGLGLGIGLASMYYSMGLYGIPTAALTILPSGIFMVFTMVIGIRESFGLSKTLASVMLSDKTFFGLKETTKVYCVKYLVLEAIVAIGALADMICTLILFKVI
ncbi:MAG: hypothetical protein GX896_08530 [Clostridiales bacterium]|nr:hypothetical protein [Clostridiales bacterium]